MISVYEENFFFTNEFFAITYIHYISIFFNSNKKYFFNLCDIGKNI